MMKKGILILAVFLLSVSLVTAGFASDFFEKLTGDVAQESIRNVAEEPLVKADIVKPAVSPDCSDSDGLARYFPGTVTKGTESYTDSCFKYTLGVRSIDFVREFYCKEDGNVGNVVLECPLSAKCILDYKGRGFCRAFCSDRDHKDIYAAGGASGYKDTTYNDFISWRDTCASKRSIKEAYCTDEGTVGSTYISCPTGTECNEFTGKCESIVPVPGCEDSDDGFNIYEKGLTKSGVDISQDYCQVPATDPDWPYQAVESCDAGDDCFLKENYCGNDVAGNVLEKWKIVKCPEGCSQGACVEPVQEEIKYCKDSDGGKVYEVKGEVISDTGIFSDTCVGDSTLAENFCEDNQRKVEKKACKFGCKAGECLEPEPQKVECADSDGKDKYNKGEVKTSQGYHYTDQCIGDDSVVEFYCLEGYAQKQVLGCEVSCKDGACVRGCYDSDGNDPTTGGVVTTPVEEFADFCSSDRGSVIEFTCDGDEPSKEEIRCKVKCEAGRCIEEEGPIIPTCKDSDGVNLFVQGIVVTQDGKYEDFCSDESTVLEYSCKKPVLSSEILTTHREEVTMEVEKSEHKCEFGCEDGACVKKEEPVLDCKDSDGGVNLFVQGVVVTPEEKYEDFCSNEKTVLEYSCKKVAVADEVVTDSFVVELDKSEHECEFGCEDGACVKKEEPVEVIEAPCDETDGGIDLYHRGIVSGDGQKYQDYCLDSITLVEFLCDDDVGGIVREKHECKYGCKNGQCSNPYKLDELDLDKLNAILEQISRRFADIEDRLDRVEDKLGIGHSEESVPSDTEDCDDQVDNDGDKWPDCADGDCQNTKACQLVEGVSVCCIDGPNKLCYTESYDPATSCEGEGMKAVPVAGEKACWGICNAYGFDYDEGGYESFEVLKVPDTCGDEVCQEGENILNCPDDCVGTGSGFVVCGDGICNTDFETAANCREDCGESADYIRQKIKEWVQGLA